MFWHTQIGDCRDNEDVPKCIYWVGRSERRGNGTHIGIWISTCNWPPHLFRECASLCWLDCYFEQAVSYISHLCKVRVTLTLLSISLINTMSTHTKCLKSIAFTYCWLSTYPQQGCPFFSRVKFDRIRGWVNGGFPGMLMKPLPGFPYTLYQIKNWRNLESTFNPLKMSFKKQ